MASRDEIVHHTHELLDVARFNDYGPNGLQLEGRAEVQRLVSGVTASRALIDAAIAARADAILVHHGLFWRGQSGALTGWLAERVRRLMVHGVNLLAYHLPLDAHPELGNNATWGQALGLVADARFGEQQLGFIGTAPAALASAAALAAAAERAVGRSVTVLPGDGRLLRRIGWCSGGAQSYFEAAMAAGADAYLTGEISEPQAHLARETGVAFIACGHHASERGGVQALGAALAARFGLEHQFIDIDNPA